MGLFTSKIALAIIAGGTVTLGGLGLTFTGGDTLNHATHAVQDFGSKIGLYETNEGKLVEKYNLLKSDATTKLTSANGEITELEGQVETLNGQITTLTTEKATLTGTVATLQADVTRLNGEIATLKTELASEKGAHSHTKEALKQKEKELATANANLTQANKDLAAANAKIAKYEQAANEVLVQAQKADKLVKELEGEIMEANEAVAKHGEAVEAVKNDTSADVPMTQDEIDAMSTTVEVEATEGK